ncbi:hypothetical protein AHF37_05908 [Paragonimus kellicotti]|nr:hypothetical protein AHF37_05908 [Paragonimus kellicotti]
MPDNTKTPMHTVDNLPPFVALTDGQLTSTPEPKLKRRRSSAYSRASYLEEAEKENRLDACDQVKLPPEDTSNTPKPSVNSATVSNQQFDLPTHSWNVSDSRSASSGHESTEDMDVSIADLVKTRRRQSTPRLFPASSTPTRNSLPRFTS